MRKAEPGRPFYGASDSRDNIFALLGIASDTELLGIRPDYHKPVEQLYTEVTKAMIMHCPGYRLEYCTFPKDTTGLPSWVPDWQRIGHKGIEIYPFSYKSQYDSSQGRTQPSTTTETSSPSPVLQQRGIAVDYVAAVLTVDESGQIGQDVEGPHMTFSRMLKSRASRTKCLKAIRQFAEPHFK